ncbi:hypothetical protein D3C78_675830 [compost metagenome]
MALDLRLVAHAADAEAVEGPAQGFGDGLADAGLAHAGRAHQQHDGAGNLALEGAHGEEFEDAVLHVVEARVVLVQHLAGVFQVETVLAVDTPGHRGRPVQVVAGDGVFRRAGLQDRQLVQFFVDALLRLLGQDLAVQAGAEAVGVGALVVLGDAQLLLDDLQLFLEEELALVLADLAVHLGRQFALQARHLHFLAQQRQDPFHALEHRHRIQHLLQLAGGGGGQGGGEVGQRRRVVGAEAIEVVLQLLAVQGVERQQFLDRVDQRHAVGLDLVTRVQGTLRIVHLHQVGRPMALEPAADAHPLQALGNELQLAAIAAGMVHAHQGAVLGQGAGVEVARVFRRLLHEEQRQAVVVGLGHQLQGFRPGFFIDDHRQHLGREEGAVVDGNDVDLVRQGLAGQHQACPLAGSGFFDDVGVDVLIAHGGTWQLAH